MSTGSPSKDKAIAAVQKKLSMEQNMLCNKSQKRSDDLLVITTRNLFFLGGTSIKKIIPIKQVNYLTLAILGIEMLLHCTSEWIRIESNSIVKIIGNLLLAKEKFLQDKSAFTVHLEIQRTLENLTTEESMKKSFWNIFSTKKPQKLEIPPNNIRGSNKSVNSRSSFSLIQVSQKNFILEIGKMVCKAIFQDCELLYISGQGIQGFRFDAENYQFQDLDSQTTVYWKLQSDKVKYLRRKIMKPIRADISKKQSFDLQHPIFSFLQPDSETKQIRNYLKTYRYRDYSLNILYALEFHTHFQVYTPLELNHIYCSQFIEQQNVYSQSTHKTLSTIDILSESDLRSIFYKVHDFIQDESQKGVILSSISPEQVYIGNGDVRISTVFSFVESVDNINYLAPQQLLLFAIDSQEASLQNQQNLNVAQNTDSLDFVQLQNASYDVSLAKGFSELEIYKINLWKAGMLLYELSYCKLPFPIQYVASKVRNKESLKVNFPINDTRTMEFQNFIRSLLCKDPIVRGMRLRGQNAKASINPYIQNIQSHEWIKRAKN